MLVYVLNKYGQPLMPTSRCGKVKNLLNRGEAKVIKRCPFTIQLLYDSNNYTQLISLGIDAGSKVIGVSATTEAKELYSAEVELRNDIVDLISTKRELRHSRRNRKTRYRKPRFDNRKNQKDGWLAPSVQHKINTHIRVVDDVCKILPITNIIVEVASFDIQKIKNPDIQGVEYQQGEQLDFWNTREYVLFRDGHVCQCCKGKSKDPRLNVHHIESRKVGGDAPNNLITLCETCHKAYHQGSIELPKHIKRGMAFRDAAFMGVMRWAFYKQLKYKYCDIVSYTFGYITKNTRIENNLYKTHCVDARCISGNPNAIPLGYYYHQKKVRNHNRSLHKSTILKGGIRKSNQATKYVFGYQLFDKVLYNGVECYIFGRRASGYFDLRLIDGTKIAPAVNYTRLKLLEKRKTILTERNVIMDEKTNVKELRTIIDSISTDSVIKAIEIINIIRKYGIYPSGKIQDICNQLPGLGMPNDYPITEMAFMFALGQAYQTKNSKVLNLFVEDLIKEYSSAHLRYKECYNNAENHYEKAIYEGLVTSTSNIIFDLKKKLSEFG